VATPEEDQMRGRRFGGHLAFGLVAAVTLALTLTGCGEDEDEGAATTTTAVTTTANADGTTTTTTMTTDPDAETVPVGVFFVRGEHVAVARADVEPPETARGALEALVAGPGADVSAQGMSSAVPDGTELLDVDVSGGSATVDLSGEFVSGGGSLSMQLRAAQVVFTLTQFDTVDSVTFRIDGEPVDGLGGEGIPANDVDRSDFTDVTPLILVTSPLPGTEVDGSIQVEGISNTFEATVLYEVLGPDGEVLDEGFTTASAGTGTWGDFSFGSGWSADVEGEGRLVVYQEDMESGGRQDVYEVELRMG
jgi:germination protein M